MAPKDCEHVPSGKNRREVARATRSCECISARTLHRVKSLLLTESRSLWHTQCIPEYDLKSIPSAIYFLRNHVNESVPLIIRGAACTWPALSRWTLPYLCQHFGHAKVPVTLTPDGRSDAISECGKYFARGKEEYWQFERLLRALKKGKNENGNDDDVPYYAAQDDCLNCVQLKELQEDIEENVIDFAKIALGIEEPSARNLWIGDERSVTSMHADPFENLYVVVTGKKIFNLRPPCDAALIPKPKLRNATWQRCEHGHKKWELVEDVGSTRWFDDRPSATWPGRHVSVEVFPGDLLYLPALWLHGVSQQGITIAVNFWFDMTYGRHWVAKRLFDCLRMDDEEEDKDEINEE